METSKKNQIRCGLWEKFGPNYSNVVRKVKKQVISLGFFFDILRGDYLLKQEAVVVKPPECKFMAIIARNAKF